jgi:Protein of unknown function (DUF1091)
MSKNMLRRTAYMQLRSAGRLPTRCPITPGDYYLKNLKIDGRLLPPLFSATKLSLYIGMFYEDVSPVEKVFDLNMVVVINKSV